MKASDYLQSLYTRADALCAEIGIGYRAVESLYAVMLQEYVSDYESMEPLVTYGNSIEYERERMSYILGQCVKLSHPALVARQTVSQLKKGADLLSGPEMMQAALCDAELLSQACEQTVMSADTLVSAVLSHLSAPFERFLVTPLSSVLPRAYAESAYMAESFREEKLGRMRARLEEEERKARELEAILNRQPVEKVGEEETVRQRLLSHMHIERYANHACVTLPFFFSESEEPLSLTVTQHEGRVYVSDGGRAFAELCRRLCRRTADRMTRYFARVQLERKPDCHRAVVTGVRDVQAFFDYLQTLALIANADLYPRVDEDCFRRYKKYTRRQRLPRHGEVPAAFLAELTDALKVSYDPDRGIGIHAPFYFNDEACPMRVCFTVAGEGRVTATDVGDFDGGRLYQRMEWLNEDVHANDALINAVCARFGAECGEERITYTFPDDGPCALPRAYFTFLQLATVLGEIGHFIVP